MKRAYNKAFKAPVDTDVQEWRDTKKINFIAIFISKLNNLTNAEATFSLKSDSKLTEKLKVLCQDLEEKRGKITRHMLGDGDYYIFPATNSRGEIYHSFLTQQQVRIQKMDGDEIREATGIIDWVVDNNNRVFLLLRHHSLDDNGTLVVSYSVVNEDGKGVSYPDWDYLNGRAYSFANAKHIGFGRYKSPQDDRGLSPVYGVPLNFGCAEIEKKIFNDLKLIEDEFKNGKSKVFTDPRNLLKDDETKGYKFDENIIPIQSRAGQNGPQVEIFNPTLRYSEHYSKLVTDMTLYEREVGTSKGILTENETSYTATATAVKRANSDTIAKIDDIRTAIDAGNQMTLEADAVFLNISRDLWSYSSDWYDPFEDPDIQWQRLMDAKSSGAAEDADLVKWMFPNLSDDEVTEKVQRIKASEKGDTDAALDRIFSGENDT